MNILDLFWGVVQAYSLPQLQSAPSASTDIEVQQLVANFQRLDPYGRKVALAMLAGLAKLKGGAA